MTTLRLDRDALAHDTARLRDFFGLLVHAHYRTTPSDLHRALDAPNLSLHAALLGGRVVGASLVAREGGLPLALCQDLAAGRGRIRGHALADTLIVHAGQPLAGTLRMARSVRIATHPELRRLGLARTLVDHVHAAHPDAELFGTLFGATADLLAFRRSVGYELVRVGVSRGSRTGEPAAVMARAVTAEAATLVVTLRAELARSLPAQLALLASDGELALEPAMEAALLDGLGPSPPPTEEEQVVALRRYLASPQPYEGAAWALEPFVTRHRSALAALGPRERRLVEARVLEHAPWPAAAHAAGFDTTAGAMRAFRPAMADLWAAVTGTRTVGGAAEGGG